MQDLQLIGVHEDGEHLLLSGADDERFQMPVDEALRAAIRHDRPRLGQLQIEVDGGLRPRDVQALIRAGASTDEAASRAGWSVDKVHRYAGPILAEREHVAGLAQQARLRSARTGVSNGGSAPTLSTRVTERLKARNVEVTDAGWDSWRTEGGPWTVVLTFAAGGRQRQASWNYDLADRTVSAVDDEARWLSEEVQDAKGPIPAPRQRPVSRQDTTVYDVEAEGGLRSSARDEHQDDPLDLMTAMRRRSTARSRRKPGGRGASSGSPKAATTMPHTEKHPPEQALPLENLQPAPEPAEALTAAADEGLVTEGSSPHDSSASEMPPSMGEQALEPVAKSASQGQSKARPKRPLEAARKPGRPSIPAWDEIVFGSRPGVDRSSS